MTITVPALPVAPSSADPTNFDTRADAWSAALPSVITAQNNQNIENNTLNSNVNTKAGEALTSANAAALSKTNADTARDSAIAARNAAETALDSFDDRYLGAKATAPTLDNDGNALIVGALYWDTTIPGMRAYTGTAWTTLPAATAGAVANTPAGNIVAVTVQAAINELDAEKAKVGANSDITSITGLTTALSAAQGGTGGSRLFSKADTQSVAFTKTGAGTAQLKAGTYIDVNGTLAIFTAATTIVMPTLTAGVDYAIYACTDSTVRADASFSAPSGYNASTSRKIGGFHYAPGGNATGRTGGDSTAAINEYSFWDLKFKPACQDPRGMALVADGFWADIYLLGVDHLTNGTSKYNVTIADGSSPPKIPTKFGGNGTTAYGSLNWWEAAEVMAAYGKRLPTYAEFAALAFGTTEASSGGTDPGSTILRAAYTSKWGVMLATGNLWQWGAEFGGGTGTAAWTANTGGRGSTYQMENAAFLGGDWVGTSDSGSRCSAWAGSPTVSGGSLGSRGVCDPLILE
jgi:hypothetical protein